ncbi:kelch repeat-containing protein 3-like isoform X2 [Salvia miltiorrhiza]|uniref:kelch repeat-containing protein 3-like isoform X2 n=1 Tax=Salvia miltiorrhiza TaxID=226208 RepID=UPI0025AC28CF|nr:kelch repeat-containing protein 3-like isoform X2 [Salvia miltiorrhiza]
MWCLDPKTWVWNKVKKTGMPPGPRAGFSMAVHKKRALLFGGVVDMEMEGDVMMSLFLNEIYGFQLDNHRWYPLELRKEKATKHKLKKDSDERVSDVDLQNNMKVAERQSSSLSVGEDADSMEGNVEAVTLLL